MNLQQKILFVNGVRYQKTDFLGFGQFGVVYQFKNLNTSELVAIKEQNQFTSVEKHLLEKMYRKQFKKSCKYQGLRINPEEVLRCDGILLNVLTQQNIRYLMKEIANGIKELHDLGFAHRSIKPENILTIILTDNEGNKQETYKLCGFGTAKQLESLFQTQGVGIPYYMAPEQLNNNNCQYDKSVDIWAFGVVCYELFTGQQLFKGYSETEIYNTILKSNIEQDLMNLPNLDIKYKILLIEMLQKDPSKRILIDGADGVIDKLKGEGKPVSRIKIYKEPEVKKSITEGSNSPYIQINPPRQEIKNIFKPLQQLSPFVIPQQTPIPKQYNQLAQNQPIIIPRNNDRMQQNYFSSNEIYAKGGISPTKQLKRNQNDYQPNLIFKREQQQYEIMNKFNNLKQNYK